MNYLAHLYLSFDNEEILVGNYIADAVKGRQIEHFQPGIKKGIVLHRKIDEFTDNHPVVSQSKDRIRMRYRKYAGVVIDMYYDHFLAVGWQEYSDISLQQFTKNTYRTLFKFYMKIPPKMKLILPAMAIGNWLASYAEIDNIGMALRGMSTRTTFDSGIENGRDELIEYYEDLKNDFKKFFPELIDFSKSVLKTTP
ncbi:MAG: ACP phosphodiesterase [Bacteroidales bacterium]|nr:ACP phosphodiesterase [Bacteroidales bacterium]